MKKPMSKTMKFGQITNLIGLLLICATIILRRGDYNIPDFAMGLMTGCGIGFMLFGLFQIGRSRSKA